jgi:hypothetical protein
MSLQNNPLKIGKVFLEARFERKHTRGDTVERMKNYTKQKLRMKD